MILLLSPLAAAATWTVGSDAATVADTVLLAAAGDTVRIPAGTWYECLDTAGKSLSFEGEGATLDGTGLCDNTVRVVYGETVRIDGLTVANTGGRAFDVEWSVLELDGVTVSGVGRTDWSGGGIWAYGAAISTTDCVFSDNVASEGAAGYLYAYATWTDQGSTFSGNTVGGSGGAVMAYYDNTLSFTGSTFSSNSAGYYGGGIATWDYTDLALSGVTFTSNAAPSTGGGAVFYYPVDSTAGVLTVDAGTFSGNQAVDGGAFWIGWADAATITSSTFEGNTATGTGGALLAYVTDTTTLTSNTFCGNTAVSGGAVSVQWTNTDTWERNVFVENDAAYGGGAHRYASYAGSMLQNTFAGNVATSWGGAYYASWAYADVRNNVFAASTGAALYTAEAATSSASALVYDGFAGNTSVDGAGYFYVGSDVDGNVVADDPGFVSYAGGEGCAADLRLLVGSPFKDAGDPEILDVDGSRSDMGAWGGPGAPVTDGDGDSYDTTTDCDDTDAGRSPAAEEVCNGLDDDCDGVADDDAVDGETWYADADGDGYGDADAPETACDAPDGAVDDNLDCDDTDRWVNPGASDYPGDGLDADCDGVDNTQVIPAASEGGGAAGCGCRVSPAAPGSLLGPLALLLLRRRRHR